MNTMYVIWISPSYDVVPVAGFDTILRRLVLLYMASILKKTHTWVARTDEAR